MPAVSRLDDLRGIDQAIARITRVSTGRVAARHRAERSGVMLSRPSIAILSALKSAGAVRPSSLARLTDLEAPLISREIRDLCDGGYVRRSADPTDGRAGIVELTSKGHEAWQSHRAATDQITAETFAGWSAPELHELRLVLDRLSASISHGPDRIDRASRAS